MKRFAIEQLKQWKDKKDRKPLIIRGARQVGKTWLMKEFGRTCFDNVAYVNFDSNARMENVFDDKIDFLVQGKTSVIPIEVKAEENLRAKSLRAFCDKYNPDYAVRTSMSDYREQDWMTNIPLYNIDRITTFTSR